MPQVQDPFFHESVVLLVHHGEDGSFGLIVNRPTDLKIVDILDGMELNWKGSPDSLAFFGGPVQPHQGTVLYRGETDRTLEIEGASEVSPGIHTTQNLSDLEALANTPPAGLRLVLGYAGWGEEQLVQEILRNDWITAPVSAELIFSKEPSEVWPATLRSVGVDPASLPSWTDSNGLAN
jgi:putative transcriptional regulator